MATLLPGLCSVTFRQLSYTEVIGLVKQAGLECIEWGGDIHVPHGNTEKARQVRSDMKVAGLKTAAYGSYYRVGESEADGLSFHDVLATAKALGAPTIRVWAGTKGSDEADAAYKAQVVADAKRIADMARTENLSVSFEFHRNTLTDTNEAATDLFTIGKHDNLYTFWQPPHFTTPDYRAEGLLALRPLLTNIHVFYWPEPGTRRPLAEASAEWQRYFRIVKQSPREHPVLLEFVAEDSPEAFLQDAKTLIRWV